MTLLEGCLPNLPACSTDLAIYIIAILGTIMLIYSQFVEAENRRDLIRMIGSFALLVYAVFISDKIFIAATAGIFIAALVEFIEIYTGIHKHKKVDIDRYKKMKY
jgi:hypothetical protein